MRSSIGQGRFGAKSATFTVGCPLLILDQKHPKEHGIKRSVLARGSCNHSIYGFTMKNLLSTRALDSERQGGSLRASDTRDTTYKKQQDPPHDS